RFPETLFLWAVGRESLPRQANLAALPVGFWPTLPAGILLTGLVYLGHVSQDCFGGHPEKPEGAGDHSTSSARSTLAVDNHAPTGSELVRHSVDDVVQQTRFSLRITRPPATIEILKSRRPENSHGRWIIQGGIVGQTDN
ncbi:MAG TPA: hypothetical protein VIV15_11390, partial [Anaerolineales bacterium]